MDVFYVSSSFHLVPSCTLRFAEALEVDDFPSPEELDDVVDIRVVGKTQDVVVGDPCLLLGSQVFSKVCNQVSLDRHAGGAPGEAAGGGGIDSGKKIIVIDNISAGIGDRVIITTGSSARRMLGDDDLPVDAVVVGIIDDDCDFE